MIKPTVSERQSELITRHEPHQFHFFGRADAYRICIHSFENINNRVDPIIECAL